MFIQLDFHTQPNQPTWYASIFRYCRWSSSTILTCQEQPDFSYVLRSKWSAITQHGPILPLPRNQARIAYIAIQAMVLICHRMRFSLPLIVYVIVAIRSHYCCFSLGLPRCIQVLYNISVVILSFWALIIVSCAIVWSHHVGQSCSLQIIPAI